jgi:selenocysteine lyase/cysteine desulfurase
MSPGLHAARAAGIAAMEHTAQPWTIRVEEWFEPVERLKALFAAIIQASANNIALIPSVSYGIAVAKKNIKLSSDQEIVVLHQQYPSNVYAWRELARETGASIVTVSRSPDQSWTEAVLQSIRSTTGLVAVPNCHWTNGALLDLEVISARAKAVGACLVVDASQSAGVYPLDIQRIKPDFLVTTGYKWLLGPYGLACLYADDKYFDQGEPIEYAWIDKAGSENFAGLVQYTDTYKPGARRFDAGGHAAFVNVPMAIEGLSQILTWGVQNIQDSITLLTDRIVEKAGERGYSLAAQNRVGHILGIEMPESRVNEKVEALSRNKIYVSARGSFVRISPYLYNDNSDVDRLFSIL